MRLRDTTPQDAAAVAVIDDAGLATRTATFETVHRTALAIEDLMDSGAGPHAQDVQHPHGEAD
jgi:hypothetical protein